MEIRLCSKECMPYLFHLCMQRYCIHIELSVQSYDEMQYTFIKLPGKDKLFQFVCPMGMSE